LVAKVNTLLFTIQTILNKHWKLTTQNITTYWKTDIKGICRQERRCSFSSIKMYNWRWKEKCRV